MVGLNKDKEIVAFPVCSASECELCVAKMNGERDRLQTEQELIKGVRSSLSRLLLPNTASQLEEGPTYYLVPADWMLMWRQWVNTKGKMHSGMPITLNDAMSNLLCRCGTHTPGLAIEVPAVHSIRGRWSVSHDAVELATDDEWRLLCSFHSKGQCDAVTCKLEVRTERASQEDQEEGPETKKLAGDGSKPSRTMPTSSTPELIISPEPCQAHLTQPFTKERFEVLEMADESMVLSAKPGGRRKRSRSEASIKISSADNLKHVKLLIFEALGIPVPNQRVFVHARELMRDDDSMEDAGLRIGTLMYVVNTHAVSDHDMSWLDVEIGRSMGAPIGVEMGFKNTALQGIF
ncbi:unnamed protein product [Ostreobium quekettii]|uniref:Ubiquitin-like domain-containing protein n=1 Tax=Ostreobium quekettii TaxID=121088 RepID=A0A8S1JI15_9CHLO|nr:unnamed protein product [Ostreobium quekettii]